ncbi:MULTISPECIES: carboxypeptidase-like regulatory domain-containing protein [Aequorivita]|nr:MULTISPECIES: carboxypeptidase-like regulatory domain-containing protein [Aequorivita]
MKKSIVIKIPEPCHEDWAKMTATEKGKFCNICTKEVIDLTSKNDEELVKILTKSKDTCGRVKTSQLNREVNLERKSRQSLAPLAASMLLPLTLFSNNPNSEKISRSEKPMVSMGIGRFSNNADRMHVKTTGVVRDENGNPLQNVEITSNETEARAWTNKKGEYEIYTLDKEILTFSKENFPNQIIRLRKEAVVNVFMDSGSRIYTSVMRKIVAQPEKEMEKEKATVFTQGTVTDDTGLPLPGTNIIIKGTSTGTQTDFDGNYKIETKAGDVLVFSYVGFETKEVTVSNTSNNIDVNLDMGDFLLGEVVVGGIYWETPADYQPPKDPDWYEKAKKAYKNSVEFMKIKRERRKAERKAKRKNK